MKSRLEEVQKSYEEMSESILNSGGCDDMYEASWILQDISITLAIIADMLRDIAYSGKEKKDV